MSPPGIAHTPTPPYYAVIFTPLRTDAESGYGRMAERMVELAAQQPGFLGVESARDAGGEHRVAQEAGRKTWYSDYQLRVARVEREYGKSAV